MTEDNSLPKFSETSLQQHVSLQVHSQTCSIPQQERDSKRGSYLRGRCPGEVFFHLEYDMA